MYLNKWYLDSNPYEDISNAFLVWVELPQILLSCWTDDFLRAIGNGIKKYLDRVEPKGY